MRNCETDLDLSWEKDGALIEYQNNKTELNFKITSTNILSSSCHFVY